MASGKNWLVSKELEHGNSGLFTIDATKLKSMSCATGFYQK
jgi:hypothetical protein